MDSTLLALVALLLGAVIGAAAVILIVLSLLARDRMRARGSDRIPAGVPEVLGALDDAAVVLDTSLTVRAASTAASGFGMAVGERVAEDRLRELARAVRAGAGVGTAMLTLRRAGTAGEARQVSARATLITPRLVLLVMRDITERERVEQMRRDFVANTSHELKTPVGAITLLAEAVDSAADDPAQVREFARRIGAEATRLANLTSRVMNLSRLQAADEGAEVREVAVDEIVTAAVEAHAVSAHAAGVTLVRGGKRGLFVRGDPQVLIEALGNLIANAVAYSPAGSSVGIGVKTTSQGVEIAVTDRGIGISEEDQERIFERFYRSDQARSRRTGGTGLGLSIVKHAVQRYGGEVKLWSRVGRGSTFTIQLPEAEAPELAASARAGKKRHRKKAARAATTNGAPA